MCSGLCGLRVGPALPQANSVVTVLPRMTAPAARSIAVAVASRPGRRPRWMTEPRSEASSSVSMMSLMPTGTPCSGPPPSPPASRARAIPRATDSSRCAHARISSSRARMRSRHARTSVSDRSVPAAIARAASDAVSRDGSASWLMSHPPHAARAARGRAVARARRSLPAASRTRPRARPRRGDRPSRARRRTRSRASRRARGSSGCVLRGAPSRAGRPAGRGRGS